MQVEERLKFLASGVKPRKNKEAMAEVLAELKADGLFYGDTVNVRKTVDSEGEDNNEEAVVEKKRDKKSKDKKDKKDKKTKKAKEEESLEEDSEVEQSKKSKKRVKA